VVKVKRLKKNQRYSRPRLRMLGYYAPAGYKNY